MHLAQRVVDALERQIRGDEDDVLARGRAPHHDPALAGRCFSHFSHRLEQLSGVQRSFGLVHRGFDAAHPALHAVLAQQVVEGDEGDLSAQVLGHLAEGGVVDLHVEPLAVLVVLRGEPQVRKRDILFGDLQLHAVEAGIGLARRVVLPRRVDRRRGPEPALHEHAQLGIALGGEAEGVLGLEPGS